MYKFINIQRLQPKITLKLVKYNCHFILHNPTWVQTQLSIKKYKLNHKSQYCNIKTNNGKISRNASADIMRQSKDIISDEDVSNIPDKGPGPHPALGNFTVAENRVCELLLNKGIHKGSGQYEIPTRRIKERADNFASMFTPFFQASISQKATIGVERNKFSPSLQKGRKI